MRTVNREKSLVRKPCIVWYVNQTNLNVKFSTKLRDQAGGQPKPGSPLEPLLGNTRRKHRQLPAIIWNFYYDAKTLLKADYCIMITSN